MPSGRPSQHKPCCRCNERKRRRGYSYCQPCLVAMRADYLARASQKSVYEPAPPRKRGPDTDDTRVRHVCDVCRAALYDESTRCSYCAGLTPEASGSTLHAERRA